MAGCDRWGPHAEQRPEGPIGEIGTWAAYYRSCDCQLCRDALDDVRRIPLRQRLDAEGGEPS